jgi:hypothetical protein
MLLTTINGSGSKIHTIGGSGQAGDTSNSWQLPYFPPMKLTIIWIEKRMRMHAEEVTFKKNSGTGSEIQDWFQDIHFQANLIEYIFDLIILDDIFFG